MAPTDERGGAGDAPRRARPVRAIARERELLQADGHGDDRARASLLASNLGLVRSTAWVYRGAGLPFDDLVQEGALGLLEAIDRYDIGRGVPFGAYARFRVRRAIRNALTDRARLIRLPKGAVERQRLLADLEERLTAEHGRAPTLTELAAAAGLAESAVAEVHGLAAPVSLDGARSPDGTTLEALLPDDAAADPESEALADERTRSLRSALATLPARQRLVVDRRFGLTGRPMTAAELAQALGRSERRIRTVERDALYALRLELREIGFEP